MTDTLTPGSEWLLPVIYREPVDDGLNLYKTNDGHLLLTAVEEVPLIPASRLADLEAEVERLRAGLTAIWDDTYPRSYQRNGQCKHGQYTHEQCEECIWDYAHSILNPKD